MFLAYGLQLPTHTIHIEPATVADDQLVPPACHIEFGMIEDSDFYRAIGQ